VIWPIIPNTKPKNYIFNSLWENETFIDSAFIWENMYLLTSDSKIVKFTKNGYFSYMDVAWQKTWEKAKEIVSYAQNIYLIWNDNQINKHVLYW
jgi:guanylate kinase